MPVMSSEVSPSKTKGKKQASQSFVRTLFPFLRWFDHFNMSTVRNDLISGITVALVLIPQSMAYAQLAGLPAYYGLYAAFLPPTIAAMFGSSHQLATGPVAVVSLMTATALAPLATAGSESFIAYAILLALMVGLVQFLLGVFRLGLVVNFLSHPVVNGFTNAAAIIIATSQMSKLFGVSVDRYEHHYETIYQVIKSALVYTHWPTLLLALLAFALMYGLKRINNRIPNVLVAVIVTTLISYLTGFEKNRVVTLNSIESEEVHEVIEKYNTLYTKVDSLTNKRFEVNSKLKEAEKKKQVHEVMGYQHELSVLNWILHDEEDLIREYREEIRLIRLDETSEQGETGYYLAGTVPETMKVVSKNWRMKVKNQPLDRENLSFIGGGQVVGNIPRGLPKISPPKVNLEVMVDLIAIAFIISLLGFMEAISIAKAMAAKTGQRLDPNQELIGQGLANIVGSASLCYPVSGSFSRSAVNIQSGAITGMSSVFSSLVVMITLLFFTPLLYHLPQSVLAAIIMMAVIGLVNIKGIFHAWQAQKYDGAIALISFVATLGFAPHLDKGIMIGVVLSVGHYLFRNIKPEVAILSKYVDGTFRSSERRKLKQCRYMAVLRFNNSLFFANVNYLEDKILELISSKPELRHVHIVCNGINELDASGEDTLSLLITRLREKKIDLSLSGVNENVMDTMMRTHLIDKIGYDRIFGNVALAVYNLHDRTHKNSKEDRCPLLDVVPQEGVMITSDDKELKGKEIPSAAQTTNIRQE